MLQHGNASLMALRAFPRLHCARLTYHTKYVWQVIKMLIFSFLYAGKGRKCGDHPQH